jgi:hypothetical protein
MVMADSWHSARICSLVSIAIPKRLTGHNESGAVNAGIPDPAVVEADIKRLDDWVAILRK